MYCQEKICFWLSRANSNFYTLFYLLLYWQWTITILNLLSLFARDNVLYSDLKFVIPSQLSLYHFIHILHSTLHFNLHFSAITKLEMDQTQHREQYFGSSTPSTYSLRYVFNFNTITNLDLLPCIEIFCSMWFAVFCIHNVCTTPLTWVSLLFQCSEFFQFFFFLFIF